MTDRAQASTPDLIIGGVNQITRFLLPHLLETSAVPVTVVSRQARPAWCPSEGPVQWHTGGIGTPGSVPDAVRHLYYLAPLSLYEHLPEGLTAKRVVAVSSTSIQTKATSSSASERKVVAALRAGEQAIMDRCQLQGMSWTILRPTLIYGCGMDRNLSSVANWIRRYGFLILPRERQGLRQPVHAQDVAFAAIEAAGRAAAANGTYVLSGRTTLTYDAMLHSVFEAVGRRPRTVSIPAGVMKSLLRVARLLPGLGHLDPAMIDRFQVDLVFDHDKAQAELDFTPREFAPDAACFPGA